LNDSDEQAEARQPEKIPWLQALRIALPDPPLTGKGNCDWFNQTPLKVDSSRDRFNEHRQFQKSGIVLIATPAQRRNDESIVCIHVLRSASLCLPHTLWGLMKSAS
jgi:hypothetical protein